MTETSGPDRERWRRAEQILLAALEQPEPERASLVARLGAGDDDLRREVESLLRHRASAERFLESAPQRMPRG